MEEKYGDAGFIIAAVVLALITAGVLLVYFLVKYIQSLNKNRYSKAAVEDDTEECSETCRTMEEKCRDAGFIIVAVVLALIAAGVLLMYYPVKHIYSLNNHCYSKAAVAADAEECSEKCRTMEEKYGDACFIIAAVVIAFIAGVLLVSFLVICKQPLNKHSHSNDAVVADTGEWTMEEKCRVICFIILAGIIIGALIIAGVFLIVHFPVKPNQPPNNHCYSKAAVAADAEECSEIGRDMLKCGGSAVDAAIAALLCVGLFSPHSMGMGGGHYFIIYNGTTGKVETIDARETAPRNATRDMFHNDPNLAKTEGLSIAVPGELRGYELAHRRHGRLPWRKLFQPSIRLARDGIPVSSALAKALRKNKLFIQNNPELCEVFCDSNKNILRKNDIIRFPRLADTYKRIAEGGAAVFYNGSMAETIVNDIQAAGGIITLEDLSGYTAEVNESPLKINIGEYTMHFPDAPSSGPVLALMLNILQGYNFSHSSVSTVENKTLTYHRITEAFRFAFAERSKLGDPRYLNITDLIHNMTSDYFADNIRSKISDNTTHPESYYGPEYFIPEHHGTAHLSVIAEDGSAVAVTSTINLLFGSKVRSRSTGIIFNDIMDDFSSNFTNGFNVPPSPKNFIEKGKRPLSSMCPTVISDKHNKVKMVVGGAGGTKITTATALVILNSLFFNYDLRTAVEESRFHNQLWPNYIQVEEDFEESIQDGLQQKKHVTEPLRGFPSVVQAVVRDGNQTCAESDHRKGGKPAGY